VALEVYDGQNDIWIWDFEHENLVRFTFDPGQDRFPVWSPDGKRIVFSSSRAGGSGARALFRQAADGTGPIEQLAMGSTDIFSATSFLPDATGLLVYGGQGGAGGQDDISIVELEHEGRVAPLLHTAFSETTPALSPDGHWLVYGSDESGREEIYVRPFPDVEGGRWQISTEGGSQPLWAHNGRELFYRDGESLLSVPIETDGRFEHGSPQVLFGDGYYVGRGAQAYDVSKDDQRFLMIKELEQPLASQKIIIVENWFTELERLAPTK
jgi:Tol biopolymer transport system component